MDTDRIFTKRKRGRAREGQGLSTRPGAGPERPRFGLANSKEAGQEEIVRKALPVAGPFQTLTVGFSTKPTAVIKAGSVSGLGSVFEVYSNVALDQFPLGQIRFSEVTAI